MENEKDYRPCPDCEKNPGYVWVKVEEGYSPRPCPTCKGTGLIVVEPVEIERDKMSKAFHTGDNT